MMLRQIKRVVVDSDRDPLQKLVEEMGMELREFSWPDRWWLAKESRMLEAHDTGAVFECL